MGRLLRSLFVTVGVLIGAAGASATFGGLNGRVAYSEAAWSACPAGFDRNIVSVRHDGSAKRLVTSGCDFDESPSWSGDGSLLAFARNTEIFVVPEGGGSPRRVFSPAATGTLWPSLSPDGTRIVFADEGGVEIVGSDGRGHRWLTNQALDSDASWSRDGRKVVFTRNDRPYTMNPDGSEVHAMRPGSPYDPARSPDGRLVLLRNLANDQRYVRRLADGSEYQLVPESLTVLDAVWSPDSRFLILLATDEDAAAGCCEAYYLVQADGRMLRQITPDPEDGFGLSEAPAWQPRCTHTGTPKADVLVGTVGADVLCGYGGNDRLDGRGGADIVYGGGGDDVMTGGRGDDLLFGAWGADTLDLVDGERDTADGGPGRDIVKRDPVDRVRL